MAISKILHMKDSGNSFHARHLKRALDYVMNPEKTQGGRLVGAINCQADMAFEQMMDTKKQFGKTDKRQVLYALKDFLIKQLGSLLEHTTQNRRKERKL